MGTISWSAKAGNILGFSCLFVEQLRRHPRITRLNEFVASGIQNSSHQYDLSILEAQGFAILDLA
jgi:hypothetical protein